MQELLNNLQGLVCEIAMLQFAEYAGLMNIVPDSLCDRILMGKWFISQEEQFYIRDVNLEKNPPVGLYRGEGELAVVAQDLSEYELIQCNAENGGQIKEQ